MYKLVKKYKKKKKYKTMGLSFEDEDIAIKPVVAKPEENKPQETTTKEETKGAS